MSVVSKYHCKYCFDTLISKLTKDKQPIINEFENNQFPLFVTWNINKGGESNLRGCIGNFGEMDLVEGLKDYALIRYSNLCMRLLIY
jgi:AMMECR1 domain-containing protein